MRNIIKKIIAFVFILLVIFICFRRYYTPLFDAASEGDLERVKQLIEKGHKVNYRGPKRYTPLIEALRRGHYDVAEYLIDHGADINIISPLGTPLGFMSLRNDMIAAKLLISKNADVNLGKGKYTPLHNAVMHSSYDVAVLLINNGADINKGYETDFSPLKIAQKMGDEKMINLLKQHGAKESDQTEE